MKPGSDAAIGRGCTCPVLDNGHGMGLMGIPGLFAFSADCPLHNGPIRKRLRKRKKFKKKRDIRKGFC